MSFNMTGVETARGLWDIILGVDHAIAGVAGFQLLGGMILITIFVVVLLRGLRSNPPPESFFIASIVGLVTSLLLSFAALASEMFIYIFIFILILSSVGLYKSKSN